MIGRRRLEGRIHRVFCKGASSENAAVAYTLAGSGYTPRWLAYFRLSGCLSNAGTRKCTPSRPGFATKEYGDLSADLQIGSEPEHDNEN